MSYISHHEPLSLLNEVNRVLGQAFHPTRNQDTSNIETSQWIPAVDIKEEPNSFIFYVDIPGVNPNDIEISMKHNVLTIKGVREPTCEAEKNAYHREERVKGNFYRRFTLPDTADANQISAKSKHGILSVIIGKKEIAQSRKIPVQVEE